MPFELQQINNKDSIADITEKFHQSIIDRQTVLSYNHQILASKGPAQVRVKKKAVLMQHRTQKLKNSNFIAKVYIIQEQEVVERVHNES